MKPIFSPLAPRTCPHSDCGQVFDNVIYENGIIFCPHCQKSILVNPFTPDLEQITFWQFTKYFTKHQYKIYTVVAVMFAIFYAIIFTVYNFDKLNLGTGFWITFAIIIGILIVMGIFAIENNLKYYHAYKLKNKLIVKGVDIYDTIKNDFNVSLAHDELKTTFNRFTAYCPHCQSQRLHKTIDDDFVCQNCHTTLRLNPKLKNISLIQFILNYLIAFLMIRYLGADFYFFILFTPALFLINLLTNYHWYKTPKWLL
ncbi:hypothetical protein MOVS_10575 [Moraxella ovis]|uniref:Uncharacterized protein n=1 Tax=Moraxella ovis TaxID=29433 RepID=A0A378PP77_9GAMM|nr:hypothetical protein [Moraxella ovis]ANB92337.1 hypothetical protein MOVS_10575 [Moraxella ovis]STY88176.1 Uncharacterised protein [Moraxella ovis]